MTKVMHRGKEQAEDVNRRQRMPERAAGKKQRNKSAYGGKHRHQHWTQPRQPGLYQRLFERQAFSTRILDEVTEHDDMAHHDAGQADHRQQRHESRAASE